MYIGNHNQETKITHDTSTIKKTRNHLIGHNVPDPVARHNQELVFGLPSDALGVGCGGNLTILHRQGVIFVLEVPQSA